MMVSGEALKKLQEQIAAWPMTQRFVVQQLIEDYSNIRKDLLAYKNTGLTPEEVLPKDKADEIALKLMRLANLESLCSYTRLRELAEADKDGRLVVLPCKTRQSVFLEQYPGAELDKNGVLQVCPAPISPECRSGRYCANPLKKCNDCRREFWMQEV